MNNDIQNQKTLDEMINHIAEEKNLRQLLSSYEIAYSGDFGHLNRGKSAARSG